MRRKSFAEMTCPMARALEIVGEWWTLLIVRDALLGARRFEEFRETGIADNILSARLDMLVREGILERRPYQERPLRHEYLVTEKGHDLLPALIGLGMWGMKWAGAPAPQPPHFIHTRCGEEIRPAFYCAHCAEPLPASEIHLERRTADGRGSTPGAAAPEAADATEARAVPAGD